MTFPRPGNWHLYLSASIPSDLYQPAQRVVAQQVLVVGTPPDAQCADVIDIVKAPSHVGAPLLTVTASPSGNVQHLVDFKLTSAARVNDFTAHLVAPDKPIYRHECTRVEVAFTHARTGKPLADLLTAPHPSMHALSIAHQGLGDTAAGGALPMQEWIAWPAAAEAAVLEASKHQGLDPCNLDAHYSQRQGMPAGGTLVLYVRLEHAGPHQLFVQV